MNDSGSISERADEMLQRLHARFGANLDAAISKGGLVFSQSELLCRATAALEKLLLNSAPTIVHKGMPCLLLEVFADTVLSLYFGACGLGNPARVLLRRAFELGIALVYLWDRPDEFVGWSNHDSDINFTAMISHLDSCSYKEYVQRITGSGEAVSLIDASACQRIYRQLSNVIHGKPSTFEAIKTVPHEFSDASWLDHHSCVVEIQSLLFKLWELRFPQELKQLHEQMPQLGK